MCIRDSHNDPVYQNAVRAGAGNPGTAQWADSMVRKRFVFMLRACDAFHVAVCPTMTGHKLLNELLNQGRQNAKGLREAGFSVPMTYRLADGFATASFGGSSVADMDAWALGAADFQATSNVQDLLDSKSLSLIHISEPTRPY